MNQFHGRDVVPGFPQMAGLESLNRRPSLSYVEQTCRSSTRERRGKARPWHANDIIVTELARVLLAHPGGLRRWSVMRAMRKAWERTQIEVSLKFEEEVERNFRCFCADDDCAKSPEGSRDALFFRPGEKAGEVWAAYPDRAQEWLGRICARNE